MNIGLIGVPGSGKTALADELAAELGLLGDTFIIDDYVGEFEETTGLAAGYYASWYVNTQIALRRYEHERVKRKHEHVITCGTMVETVAYSVVNFPELRDASALGIIHNMQAQVLFPFLGMLAGEFLPLYDLLLKLPNDDDYHDELEGQVVNYLNEASVVYYELRRGCQAEDAKYWVNETSKIIESGVRTGQEASR